MAGSIKYIKISRIDKSGKDLNTQLESISTLILPSGSSFAEYTILNKTRFRDYFLYYVSSPHEDDIDNTDVSTLEYIFTGSISTSTITAPPILVSQIPISSSDNDNFGFFDSTTNTYNILTLPQKDLTLNLTGNLFLSGDSLDTVSVGIYKLKPNTTDRDEMIAGELISQTFNANAGSTSINKTFILPKENINSGDQLSIRTTKTSGFFLDYNVTFSSGAKFKVSSTPPTGNTQPTIIEPYFTTDFYKSEYDVLQNNATQGIPNQLIQKISYTSGLIPTNISAIMSGSAVKADIPQSNYEISSILNPSYNRSIVQSSNVNVYNPLDRGTDFGDPINIGNYGQTPSVSSLDNVIVEFNWAGGTNPEIPFGGSFKLSNLLFEVSSADQIKTLTPVSGLDLFDLTTNIYSASNSPNAVRSIEENRGEYYQVLNNSYGPGKEIVPFIYNPTGNPTLPSFTKVVDTTIQIPSVSSYAGTSSYVAGGWFYGAYGTYVNNTMFFKSNSSITKLGTDYNTDTSIDIGTSRSQFMDIIVPSLMRGNRWFITLINDFEFPVGISSKDQRFIDVQGGSELNKIGVFEILGMDMDASNNTALYVDYTLPVGESYLLGGNESPYPSDFVRSVGFLIWRSAEPNNSKAVIVTDETSGVTAGAFYSRYPTEIVTENFEDVTKEYGSNQTG